MPERLSPAAERRFYRELGSRLRRAREDAQLTQDQMAAALGLGRASVANVEAGRQRIQLHYLVLALRALNQTFEAIVPGLTTDIVGDDPLSGLGPDTPDTHRELVARLLAASNE